MTPDGAAALRARLQALRRDALQQLAEAEVLDGGLMRLVADTSVVLQQLDEDEAADRTATVPRA